MSDHRAFRGIWIPADIWLSHDLTLQEKVMLVEIDSLQHPVRGCYKSNKAFAEFFGLSPSRVSEIIGSLVRKGWISVDQVRKGKQVIERRIFMASASTRTAGGIRNPEEGYSENASNPIRNPEGGYSENAEERGSGFRGSYEGFSHSGAGESEDIFTRAAQQTDDGQPLPTGNDRFAMTLDWQPDPDLLAAQLVRAGLPQATQPEAHQLAKFTAHHADQPNRRHGNTAWVAKLVDWIRNDLRNQAQKTQQPTGDSRHANRQQRTPARRLSAAEARARDRQRQQAEQGAEPGGSIFDGQYTPAGR